MAGGLYSARSDTGPDSPSLSLPPRLRAPSRQRGARVPRLNPGAPPPARWAQIRFPSDVPLSGLPRPFCAARDPGTSEGWVEGKRNPGPSLIRGFEMAHSGVGPEGDQRGCDPLLSGGLECGVTGVLPRPRPRRHPKVRTLLTSPGLTEGIGFPEQLASFFPGN